MAGFFPSVRAKDRSAGWEFSMVRLNELQVIPVLAAAFCDRHPITIELNPREALHLIGLLQMAIESASMTAEKAAFADMCIHNLTNCFPTSVRPNINSGELTR